MMLYRLLKHMDTIRYESRVVSMIPPGEMGEMIAELGIPVETINMQRGRPSLRALNRLARLLKQFRPDVLQTWLYHADLLGLLAGKLAGVSNILWNVRSSNMDMAQYRRLSGWTVRACSGLAAMPQGIVINSRAGLRYHTGIGYHPRRWILIPNGVDTDLFCPRPHVRRDLLAELSLSEADAPLLIGYVARFDPMKDHTTFLRAVREFVDAGYNAHFVLCGADISWSNRSLASMIDALDIRSRIYLLGSRQDVENVTAAFDLATSASLSEGFPNTVAEAMSCGVPCVVTDVGDSAEIVAHTGVVVPPGDAAALAAGWARLLGAGAAHRQRLGTLARQRIFENYSLDSMVQAYEELYGQLAGTAI
ncbi:MAG: glycosyltransferase [Chloroflexi bacterium]|nr:glycosyltransferase [Chloroflexota bacterium]